MSKLATLDAWGRCFYLCICVLVTRCGANGDAPSSDADNTGGGGASHGAGVAFTMMSDGSASAVGGAAGEAGGAGASSSDDAGTGGSAHGGNGGHGGSTPITITAPGVYLSSDEVWPSPVPSGGPPASVDLVDAVFTGRHKEYTHSDTWYPSWAADGELYSNFADGNVNGVGIGSIGDNANTGRVKITGDDPLNLTFVNAHAVFGAPGAGYNMRYPAGNLVYNGVWYSATNLRNALGAPGCSYTCTQGALVGFDYTLSPSTANAESSWVKTAHTAAAPLFPETGLNGMKVKLAEPHFVDFGKNLQYSPDGKAYLVGHGAARAADFVNWNAGSDIYLARVTPSPDNINDLSKWEFYKGVDASNSAIWSTGFDGLQPILSWSGQLGNVSITYDPPLKRYIMTLSRGNRMPDDWNRSDVLLLHSASDSLTGGWNLVRIWHDFGTFSYMPNVPGKFISADGLTFWMGFSTDNGHRAGTVRNPIGADYSYDLREVRLVPASTKAGLLTGRVDDKTSGIVNLSSEGILDWAHWGYAGFPSEDRKQGGAALLRMTNAASMFAGVTPSSYSSGVTSFTWTSGVPNASITASASAVAANDTNSGFTIAAPADTSTRTLRVYVGVSRATGELHAYLSDNSATPYRDWTVSDGTGAHNGVYTLSYRSASADQTLYVTWANAKDFSSDFSDRVALQAATLRE